MILAGNQQLTPEMAHNFSAAGAHVPTIFQEMIDSPEVFAYPTLRELTFELKMRNETINAALALSASGADFATFYYSTCNEKYWRLTDDGGFELRPGSSPAQAIRDIFINGNEYAFECATAMMIILYKALLETLTEQRFNEAFQHLYLWDWQNHPSLQLRNVYQIGKGIGGDIRYFKNPDFNPQTPQWQGENVVVLTDDRYFGHGIGIQPAEQIIDELNRFRRIGAQISAFLMPGATRPDYLMLSGLADGQQQDRIRIAAGTNYYSF